LRPAWAGGGDGPSR
ncbi:Protein of unknown function, partial [Gryllus bimaculatus]